MFSSTFYQLQYADATGQQAVTDTAPSPPTDRRREPRVSVSLEAAWEGMSGNREARVTDISLHGCFIEACAQTSPGERIKIVVKTPSGRWIQLRGEVVFSQTMIGFGLKFMEVSEQDEAMLRKIIEFYS